MLTMNAHPVQREALLVSLGDKNDIDAARKLDMLVYRLRLDQDLPVVSTYDEGYGLAAPFELL